MTTIPNAIRDLSTALRTEAAWMEDRMSYISRQFRDIAMGLDEYEELMAEYRALGLKYSQTIETLKSLSALETTRGGN